MTKVGDLAGQVLYNFENELHNPLVQNQVQTTYIGSIGFF